MTLAHTAVCSQGRSHNLRLLRLPLSSLSSFLPGMGSAAGGSPGPRRHSLCVSGALQPLWSHPPMRRRPHCCGHHSLRGGLPRRQPSGGGAGHRPAEAGGHRGDGGSGGEGVPAECGRLLPPHPPPGAVLCAEVAGWERRVHGCIGSS